MKQAGLYDKYLLFNSDKKPSQKPKTNKIDVDFEEKLLKKKRNNKSEENKLIAEIKNNKKSNSENPFMNMDVNLLNSGDDIESFFVGEYKSKNVFDRITHVMYKTKSIPLNESSIELITDMILMKYRNQCLQYKNSVIDDAYVCVKFDTGANIDTDATNYFSFVFRGADINRTSIEKKLTEKSKKNYDSKDYQIHLSSIVINLLPSSMKGGCNDSHHDNFEYIIKSDKFKMKLRNPISKVGSNNCGINCILSHLNQTLGKKADNLRRLLNIELNTMLTIDDMKKVCDHYEVGLTITDAMGSILCCHNVIKDSDNIAHLVLRDNHYMLYEDDIIKNCCKECWKNYQVRENKTHSCDITRLSFVNKKLKQSNKKDIVTVKNVKEKKQQSLKNIIFYDIESFPLPGTNVATAYAVGWKHDGVYQVMYGEGCFEKFTDYKKKKKNIILIGFNSASFDNYFLLSSLSSRKCELSDMILSNNRLLSLTFNENCKVWDLYQFIGSSLSKACDAYGIKNCKSSLDHTLFQQWSDTEKYKLQVIPYLYLDVISLEELYIAFSDKFYTKYQVNITKYVTLSSMGYALWSSMLEEIVEIPDMKKYDFQNRACYGARCYPQQIKFQSKFKEQIENNTMSYDK
jgi:hypothetical protein